MCGRYTIEHTTIADLDELFGLIDMPEEGEVKPELCPTDPVLAITEQQDGRHLDFYRWWLVPSWWNRSLKELPTLFNAKAETVAEKPAFRGAFRSRRCIVPASHFYEWSKGTGGKQKLRIGRRDHQPLALAGLWEEWRQPDGEPLRSCTIITTTPNAVMVPVHTRMPVILGPDDWSEWLSPRSQPDHLQRLLRPCPDEWLEVAPVIDPPPSPGGYTGQLPFD
jgi:putative SOS response-associated peptidase YedK